MTESMEAFYHRRWGEASEDVGRGLALVQMLLDGPTKFGYDRAREQAQAWLDEHARSFEARRHTDPAKLDALAELIRKS